MNFRMKIEAGSFEIGFNGSRGAYVRRDVTSKTWRFWAFYVKQSGLEFCQDAAGRAYDRMENGPVGALSRLYKP